MITIPDDVRKYMDISERKPKIVASAPDVVKEKACEIDKIYFELTGKKYFSNI